ncbi:hypothetical protein ACTXT7_006402 [Hymenolepis weldensis]
MFGTSPSVHAIPPLPTAVPFNQKYTRNYVRMCVLIQTSSTLPSKPLSTSTLSHLPEVSITVHSIHLGLMDSWCSALQLPLVVTQTLTWSSENV